MLDSLLFSLNSVAPIFLLTLLGALLGNLLGPMLDRELLKKALGVLFLLTGIRELRFRPK